MKSAAGEHHARQDWLRLVQWLVFIVSTALGITFVWITKWSIPIDVAGDVVASRNPESFDTGAAVRWGWLAAGAVILPFFAYAVLVARSICTRNRLQFVRHSIWMLSLLCLLPVSGLLLQPRESKAPIGWWFWLVILAVLVVLLLACVLQLQSKKHHV